MKPKERLAKFAMDFLKHALTGLQIDWAEGVTHGGGCMNGDCLEVGRWSVAVLEDGRLSLYTQEPKRSDFPSDHDGDFHDLEKIFDPSPEELDEIFITLRS